MTVKDTKGSRLQGFVIRIVQLGTIMVCTHAVSGAPSPFEEWSTKLRKTVTDMAAANPRTDSAISATIAAAMNALPKDLTQDSPEEVFVRSDVLIELSEKNLQKTDPLCLALLEHRAKLLLEYKFLRQAGTFLQAATARMAEIKDDSSEIAERVTEDIAAMNLWGGRPDEAVAAIGTLLQLQRIRENPEWRLRLENLLGESYLYLGDREPMVWQTAGTTLTASFETVSRFTNSNRVARAAVAHNLGRFHRDSRNPEKARYFAELGLNLRRAVLQPTHPDLASSKVLVAQVMAGGGHLAEASELLDEALPILKWTYGPSHLETIACLRHSALVAQWRGRTNDALLRTKELLRHQKQLALEVLYFYEAADRRYQLQQLQPFLVPGTLTSGDVPLMVEALVVFKGAVPRSHFEDRQFSLAQSKVATKVLADKWREKLYSYTSRSEAQLRGAKDDALPALAEELAELERLLHKEGIKLGGARNLLADSAGSFKKSLTKNTAVVDFILHTVVPDDTHPETRCDAMVHLAGQSPQLVRLPNNKALPMIVQRYARAMREPAIEDQDLVQLLIQLREIVWDPVARVLPAGTTNIVISPDGPLAFVSWAGLVGDGRLLGEQFNFRYAPSTGELLTSKPQPPVRKTLAAFVDPDFDLRPAEGQENLSHGSRLRDTMTEGKATVEAAMKRNWEPKLYSQLEVTNENLRGIRAPGILLIATHGFSLPSGSTYTTSSRNGLAVRMAMQSSGLAIAGANWSVPARNPDAPTMAGAFFEVPLKTRRFEPNPDGHFTAADAEGLDLSGTWLVALSACDTGFGEFGNAEGIFGLQRSFLTGGARNILLTAWPVKGALATRFTPELIAEAIDSGSLATAFGRVQSRTMIRLRVENQMKLVDVIRQAAPYLLLTREL